MTGKVIVLYACLRVLQPCEACVCAPNSMYITDANGTRCVDLVDRTKPEPEHELRTRLEEPLLCNSLDGGCQDSNVIRTFTDGDWTCHPILERER